MHLGVDSFQLHVATLANTPSVIVFGGTYAHSAVNPAKADLIRVIEPETRGLCHTSCHLIDCAQKSQQKHDKCINFIPVDKVLNEVEGVLGPEHIVRQEDIKLSAYLVVKDCIKYSLPFEQCIEAALPIVDEFVIVDGGSTDGTLEALNKMASGNKALRVIQEPWDIDKIGFIGKSKAFAAAQCTGDFSIQLDADEILREGFPGQIKEIVKHSLVTTLPEVDCVAFPIINFYGDKKTIRLEDMAWKHRVYRKGTTHGASPGSEIFDPKTGEYTLDKSKSDGCCPLNVLGEVVSTTFAAESAKYLSAHHGAINGGISEKEYLKLLSEMISSCPHVLHLSWLDLNRKEANGEFWDNSAYAEVQWHNTSSDIKQRREAGDKTFKVEGINFGI